MNDTSGIYAIRNTINNKVYIGQATAIQREKHDDLVA